MMILVNALLFSIYLAAVVIGEAKGAEIILSGQLSILLLLAFIALGAFGGKWLQNAFELIEDDALKTGAILSTFLWTGYGASLIFEQPTRLSAFSMLPIAVILISRYRPSLWRAQGFTPLLVGLSMIAQVVSLALFLKVGGGFFRRLRHSHHTLGNRHDRPIFNSPPNLR